MNLLILSFVCLVLTVIVPGSYAMSTCDKRILGVYLGVLHRYPDRGGYYFHQRKWCSGGSLGNLDQMIDYFMSSTEYKTPCWRQMRDLYINVLQRQPDIPGLKWHVNQCKHGRTFKSSLKVFINSREFTNNAQLKFEGQRLVKK